MASTMRVNWYPERAIAEVDELAAKATEHGAQVVLDAANRRVPYDKGALAESGHLDAGEDGTRLVVYDEPYALPVRKRGTALRGRSARWLDEAVESEAGDAAGRAMEETIRSGWPNG